MNPLAADPLRRHARFIAAFCEDLASAEYRRAGTTPRADAAAAGGTVTSRRRDSSVGTDA
jgi:hypothetical protein